MALEPITRQEKIIAGQDLTPITRMEMFLKNFGGSVGGGGGVQPDWNQNDSTAADYIKNRPFYSETENVTVENVTDVQLERFPAFEIGDTVTVNVDGVEHSLVAYDNDDNATIGDTYSSIVSGEGQLGWQIYYGNGAFNFYSKEAHTVSYFAERVVKIDEKYIPSGGAPYQKFVTDELGNARWATVNSVIYRDDYGELIVEQCMEYIDGSPASIEDMMKYGSISFIDDANGVYSTCVSACSTGLGYAILTFMSIGEHSSKMIKIKAVDETLADDKISIVDEFSIFGTT